MAAKRPRKDDWFICPCCGAQLPIQARFCRECGASEDSGWGEEPWDNEDDFDYEEFVQEEFPEHAAPNPKRLAKRRRLFVVVLLVIVALLLALWWW